MSFMKYNLWSDPLKTPQHVLDGYDLGYELQPLPEFNPEPPRPEDCHDAKTLAAFAALRENTRACLQK